MDFKQNIDTFFPFLLHQFFWQACETASALGMGLSLEQHLLQDIEKGGVQEVARDKLFSNIGISVPISIGMHLVIFRRFIFVANEANPQHPIGGIVHFNYIDGRSIGDFGRQFTRGAINTGKCILVFFSIGIIIVIGFMIETGGYDSTNHCVLLTLPSDLLYIHFFQL